MGLLAALARRGFSALASRRAALSARQARKKFVKHTRIIVRPYGGRDALQVVEGECPEPKGGELRVRVLAAGVSLPDLLMRLGVHRETPPLPFTPGWDLIGVVDRLADVISGAEPGQIVASCRGKTRARVARQRRPDRQDRYCAQRVIA
jgi:NADPH:quinone reductase-like Zn-dependent oxidoreductase